MPKQSSETLPIPKNSEGSFKPKLNSTRLSCSFLREKEAVLAKPSGPILFVLDGLHKNRLPEYVDSETNIICAVYKQVQRSSLHYGTLLH